jgi:REP-associated tyrosine transposase
MSRPLRIEYPNACYHVINRGDNRRLGFSGPEDYTLFLEKLGSFSEIYKIKVRAYCLMPNHFHLYIQTPEGNLSRFMRLYSLLLLQLRIIAKIHQVIYSKAVTNHL